MRPERGGVISVTKLTALSGGGGGGGGGGGPPPSLWRTPTPYVFLALAFMMGAIAVSLLVLICTRRKPAAPSSSSSDNKAAAAARELAPLDREPKVVVFMPGDHAAPSFLASAKPLEVGGDGVGAAAVV